MIGTHKLICQIHLSQPLMLFSHRSSVRDSVRNNFKWLFQLQRFPFALYNSAAAGLQSCVYAVQFESPDSCGDECMYHQSCECDRSAIT